MAILVTGGAGYIGSHTCVELLNEGHTDVMVGLNGDSLETYPLETVVAEGTTLLNKDSVYVKAAVSMGMYVGEI